MMAGISLYEPFRVAHGCFMFSVLAFCTVMHDLYICARLFYNTGQMSLCPLVRASCPYCTTKPNSNLVFRDDDDDNDNDHFRVVTLRNIASV